MWAWCSLVELDVFVSISERAALRHGVAGVHRHVHDDLLDLTGIGFHLPGSPLQDGQGNILADQAAQHLLHVRQDGVEVEHRRAQHLLAAKREQLPREIGGPFASLVDLRQRLADRIIGRMAGEEHFAITDDDGEQVVEIMSDASRKLADGFHFLGLTVLFFQRFAFGDVRPGAEQLDGLARVVAQASAFRLRTQR